ncbi:unnamed protein product [Rhizoctonia solani]|uniref:Protein kinase domain-containing protein n=1 Tax=Rhizoctonia solani TaxID=456999 RepID=A0A8H3D3G8_9AGAM|nr:unnamed protein product [Rhizoctonia solani]
MKGRENMIRDEIAVLKKVPSGHKNIVNLHDYFETAYNLYLVLDLCAGGELFDRICVKENYGEAEAAKLVRAIMLTVQHLHDAGIVHRGLKAEYLLFRTNAEDADIMIADFGLARILDDDKSALLTEIYYNPVAYLDSCISAGYHKPVDIWAVGVITYFMLCGYTPFDRDTEQQELEAIIHGDYRFEPAEYWAHVSETGKDFVRYCLTIDPNKRPTAAQALEHKWLADIPRDFVFDCETDSHRPRSPRPDIQNQFDARRIFRKAVLSAMAMRRMSTMLPKSSQVTLNAGHCRKDAQEVLAQPEDLGSPPTAVTPPSPTSILPVLSDLAPTLHVPTPTNMQALPSETPFSAPKALPLAEAGNGMEPTHSIGGAD